MANQAGIHQADFSRKPGNQENDRTSDSWLPGFRLKTGRFSRFSLQLQRQQVDAAGKVVEEVGGVLGLHVVPGGQRLVGQEIRHQRAVVAVDHDAQQLAGLAQHEIAARGREVAKEPFEESVVHAHEAGLRRVQLETDFAETPCKTKLN